LIADRRPLLLVTNDLGPHLGGIESFILGLINELDGSKLVIYTSSQSGSADFDAKLKAEHGVIVIRDKSKILLPTPRVTSAVVKVMQQFGATTIWYGATAPLAWMAPTLKRHGAIRQIGMTHGHEVWWAKLPPFSWALRRMGGALDVLTYLGEFTRDAMRPAFGNSPEYVRIAPGIAVDHFLPALTSTKPVELLSRYGLRDLPTILCVGRLVHRKGQDRLIQAMPQVLAAIPDAQLILIGIGPYEKKLRSLVKKLHVEDKVHFLGRMKYDELPKHFHLGDVFAMPSRSRFFGLEVEGLGIVYLEASASGLPVIAGASGGAPDAVREGITGVTVDGNNLDQIASALISILSNKESSKAMGVAGRNWAEAAWSWKLWGVKFADLLRL